MKLSLEFNGTESREEVEKAISAALFFTGHTGIVAQAETSGSLDPATLGFGATIDGSAAQAGGDAFLDGITSRNDDESGTVAGANVQVDKDGVAHDPRIHSVNRTINADGRWKRRRGVSDEEVAAVIAEQRALTQGAASAPPPPPAPTTPAAPPAPPAAQQTPPPPPPPATPAAPPAPPAAPAAPAAAGGDEPNVCGFGTLLRWISFQTSRQRLTADDVANVCASVGLVDGNGVGAVSQAAAQPVEKSLEVHALLKAIVAENEG